MGTARLPTTTSTCKPVRMGTSVLVVDDDSSFRAAVSELLMARGFEIAGHAADQDEAIEATQRLRPSAILLDAHLAESESFDLVRRLSQIQQDVPILLTSSDPDAASQLAARDYGAVGFVPKTQLVHADLHDYFGC